MATKCLMKIYAEFYACHEAFSLFTRLVKLSNERYLLSMSLKFLYELLHNQK